MQAFMSCIVFFILISSLSFLKIHSDFIHVLFNFIDHSYNHFF
jgi:hypothetical protein